MSLSSTSLFSNCSLGTLDSGGDNNLAILQCISDQYDNMNHMIYQQQLQTRNWLFVTCGALVFFMQAGFAMLVGGCVRKKNLQNTMLKNLLDCSGAAIAFWAIGYAFAYGGDNKSMNDVTFIGSTDFFCTQIGTGSNVNVDSAGFWFFQYTFCATTVTIIAGTLAERCQMGAYLLYSMFLTGFVYPVVVHNVWSHHGVFSAFIPDIELRFRGVGCIDFAGSGVVHLTGGTIALIAVKILGPRVGRFYNAKGEKLDVPMEFKGHSIALQLLGTLVLWFGWYGFNPGSALTLTYANPTMIGGIATKSAANTTMAAGSGALSAMIVYLLRQKYQSGAICFNITMTMNGCLSGLVAITSSSATAELWSSMLIGIVAGIIYVFGSSFLVYIMIDDAVDAIPVHMFNGLWGLLAVGLFSTPDAIKDAFGEKNTHFGWFYNMSDGTLIVNQIILACFIIAWAMVTMIPFFAILNYLGWFRSDGLEEVVGLDIRYHGMANEIDDKELAHELEDYKEMIASKQSQQIVASQQSQKQTEPLIVSHTHKD